MDKYSVKLTNRALRDLDGIYTYIAHNLLVPETAANQVDRIEDAILSLEDFPTRCPLRKVGAYSNLGYRQILIDNYTAVYRIDENKKEVIIITIRYTPSQF